MIDNIVRRLDGKHVHILFRLLFTKFRFQNLAYKLFADDIRIKYLGTKIFK